MAQKTIAVLGALGAQGGSVVRSLLAHGGFHVRAVTRSVNSDAAKSLQGQGVEVVAGDVKDPVTLETAFTGADSAFIVVNFWDPDIMMKEEELTKRILDVAKKCEVQQILYASLANVEQVSGGKLNVPHFTMKAKAFEYAKSLGFKYLTGIEAAYYYSNWFTFFKPTAEEDGTLVWTFPGKNKISAFDPNTDVGPAAVAAALDPERYNGRSILLEGDCLTAEEAAAVISKHVGKPTRVHHVDPDAFATFSPGAHEIAEMVKWFYEYGYNGPETDSSGREAAGSRNIWNKVRM